MEKDFEKILTTLWDDAAFELDEEKRAEKELFIWNRVYGEMVKDQTMTDELAYEDFDLSELASELLMTLSNSKRFDDVVRVAEQIQTIDWSDFHDQMMADAKTFGADAVAFSGDVKKALELYESYLKEDPLQGRIWNGYLCLLGSLHSDRERQVLDELYSRLKNGEEIRDSESLIMNMMNSYGELGEPERVRQLKKKLPEEYRALFDHASLFHHEAEPVLANQQPVRVVKVGRNDPCPCGSGKNYKKCCGR